MSQSNYSPFSSSQHGLRRRVVAKDEAKGDDCRRIKIDTTFLDNAGARGMSVALQSCESKLRGLDLSAATKSAVTPTHYKRAALLSLSQSPLATTCVDPRHIAMFSALISAEHSPSAAQVGMELKGLPMTSALTYPPTRNRLPSMRESPSTAVTTARWANSYKANSYSAVQFNRDNYAAMYATPFTPDHSLMKPVDLGAWTPSMTTPLVTPCNPKETSEPNKAVSIGSSSGETTPEKKQGKDDMFDPALKPSAKVFIPSGAPSLRSNPQPRRAMDNSSLPVKHYTVREIEETQRTQEIRADLSANSPSKSMRMAAHHAPFEVPKALTPLARPSAALPARPTACVITPNLPRWAHSPGHAMLASLDSRHNPAVDTASRSNIIRRATVSLADSQGLPSIRRVSQSMDIKQVVMSAQDTDDSGEDDEPAVSCVRSTSMTPWAIQRTRELSTSLMGDTAAGEDRSALLLDTTPENDRLINAKISAHQMSSPDSIDSNNAMSVKAPSSAVRVGAVLAIKGSTSFDGNSWRSQVRSSWTPSREPRKPNVTPSIPGGLLGAVPMHSLQIK